MKVASYNIMSGGFDGYDHEQAVPQRLQEIRAAVRELNVDVIGLIDTFRWDEIFSTEQLHNLFGYEYITCINLNDERLCEIGHNNGLTLMSKLPWQSCEVIKLGTRDALKASFELNGRKIIIVLAYLDDLQEGARLKQARVIVDSIGSVENALIMGDLNTIAPSDIQNVTRELETFCANNPGIKERLRPVIEQMQRAEVIAWFESQGLIDERSEGGATVPSRLFPADSSKPFLRLDYCLRGSKLKVSDFAVQTTEVMQKTSDHFPLSFTVE
jgi:endonuclease/exonuclease/phosphatase family metal-dependent hydrolase